jgi:hypothetical protein
LEALLGECLPPSPQLCSSGNRIKKLDKLYAKSLGDGVYHPDGGVSFGPLIADCYQARSSVFWPFGNAVALVPSERAGLRRWGERGWQLDRQLGG